ncbi:MAG: hypothetical protein QOH29_1816, partial [Actinomycetota bacterium]|nr:hypothetical protein [Actinomycetota bacterium]
QAGRRRVAGVAVPAASRRDRGAGCADELQATLHVVSRRAPSDGDRADAVEAGRVELRGGQVTPVSRPQQPISEGLRESVEIGDLGCGRLGAGADARGSGRGRARRCRGRAGGGCGDARGRRPAGVRACVRTTLNGADSSCQGRCTGQPQESAPVDGFPHDRRARWFESSPGDASTGGLGACGSAGGTWAACGWHRGQAYCGGATD